MEIMVLMDLVQKLGKTGDDTRASGLMDVNMARGGSARSMAMFTKVNSLLARQKVKVCSRLRRVTFTRASGSRGESGGRVCASGLTTANTPGTGREARSMDRDA